MSLISLEAGGASLAKKSVTEINSKLLTQGKSKLPSCLSHNPSSGKTVDNTIKAFNTWAFKREQPRTTESLTATVARAVARAEPLSFVLYWGRGPRETIAEPEHVCLGFLDGMIARIAAAYAPGARMTLILTDTHALLNGFPPDSTGRYFEQVDRAAQSRGFAACRLSDLVVAGEGHIDPAAAEAPLCPDTLQRLELSAAKWFRGGESIAEGAARYYRANLVERQAVAIHFPEAIFVTFNGSESVKLFPTQMPIFFMYSLRRGFAAKPWFLTDADLTAPR